MIFDTKIAVVVREDLAVWQKLNVTAFLSSGIIGNHPGLMGEPYEDGSGNLYHSLLVQPVLVYAASSEQIRRAYERSMARGIKLAVYTEDMFRTSNDTDNRATVKAVLAPNLNLVGMALRDQKKTVDKALDGLKFHP